MADKSNDTRLQDTLDYIGTVDAGLEQHLTQVLRSAANSAQVMDDVGGAISLAGLRPWYKGVKSNNTDTQRDALRALLLCQRVYLTNLWSPTRLGDTPFLKDKPWPKATVDHWRFKAENEIRDGIRMYFPVPNIPDEALADAAAVRSVTADNLFTAKRNSQNPLVGNSCFDQVSHWLLAAGYVSLRWIAKLSPMGFDYSEFGAGREYIRATDPVPRAPFNGIPRGMICRLFTDRRVGGHFMVCDGNGWGWGYNNAPKAASAEEGEVTNGHARCLIHRQFADYREESDKVSPTNFGGKLVLLDPTALPHAC